MVVLVLHVAEVAWHLHLQGSMEAKVCINLGPTGELDDGKARHRHVQASGSGDPVEKGED